jgi:uncharacterized protein YbjT (DUF2867 family)
MTIKIIAVVGATGAQGSAVINSLINNPEYSIRGLTRNPNSAKAQALIAKGVQVVAADLDDQKSLEKAFQGVYGVFGVTNYWELFSIAKEQSQIRNLVEAAKNAQVKHFVWSSLEDTRKLLKPGELPILDKELASYVPHFDGKGETNQWFRDANVPLTVLNTSFYYENFFGFLQPQKQDGVNVYTLPLPVDFALPAVATEDIGKFVAAIFKNPATIGKEYSVASDFIKVKDIPVLFEKYSARKFKFNEVDRDTFAGFGFPGADDLANMYTFFHIYKAFTTDRERGIKELGVETKKFETFLKENAEKIPQ